MKEDKLDLLFSLQEKVSDYNFRALDYRDTNGQILTIETLRNLAQSGILFTGDDPVVWMGRELSIIRSLLEEIDGMLPWDYRTKEIVDTPELGRNIRSLLFKSINLALMAGMSTEDILNDLPAPEEQLDESEEENGPISENSLRCLESGETEE